MDFQYLGTVYKNIEVAIAPFVIALALSLALTPIAIVVARRLGFVRSPRERDIHVRPVPMLGGLALFLAFGGGLQWFQPGRHWALLAITGVAAAVFVLDDRFGLHAWVKLGLDTLLALVAIVALNYQITFFTIPHFGVVHLHWLAIPISLLWLLGMVNTVNLLDGIDGLAAGVVGIVALVLLVAAASRHQTLVVVASAALAGACLGFLFFNFHPARIFMGDSGARFLGLTLGLLSISGVAKVVAAFALVVPIVALAIPILDTGWAIVRRRRKRISIAHADTRHVHHQLLNFGLSQPQTCLVLYGATGILGALGLMLFGHKRILSVAIVLLVVGVSTVIGESLQETGWRIEMPRLRRSTVDL
jgi:UDP-GlcNAc:undecaprenyl-phosphate/decaprenyl-phosphate GlcNAc-1-phosphate transferase